MITLYTIDFVKAVEGWFNYHLYLLSDDDAAIELDVGFS